MTEPPVAEYSFRRSIAEQERRYVLFPDRLVVDAGGPGEKVVPLASVESVHLKLHATKQRSYHQCRIKAAGRAEIFLQHLHYRGFADLEDRGDRYAPFVRALLERVAAAAPGARLHSGSAAAFGGNVVATIVMVAVLVVVLVLRMWIPAVIAALVLLRLVSLLPSSRPRRFDAAEPPPRLLPS